MGRPASGVAGMRLRAGDEVIEVDIAEDDADLLVVTENGWGKRTRVSDYPVKGRGAMGVKTAQLVEGKGSLGGAQDRPRGLPGDADLRRRHRDPDRRSTGSSGSGRATQGVIVMRLREGEQVSSLAPVIGSDDETELPDEEPAPEPDRGRVAPSPQSATTITTPRITTASTIRPSTIACVTLRPASSTSCGHAARLTPRTAAAASMARTSATRATPTTRIRANHFSGFGPRPSVSRNSIGIGNTIVELFVAPISSSVCK